MGTCVGREGRRRALRLVEELSGIIVAIWAAPIETAVHVAHTHVSLIVHGQFFCSHFYLDDNIEMLAKKLSRDPFFIHTHTYTCTHTSPHTHTHTHHTPHTRAHNTSGLSRSGRSAAERQRRTTETSGRSTGTAGNSQ